MISLAETDWKRIESSNSERNFSPLKVQSATEQGRFFKVKTLLDLTNAKLQLIEKLNKL